MIEADHVRASANKIKASPSDLSNANANTSAAVAASCVN
jgi:hypothetical protein